MLDVKRKLLNSSKQVTLTAKTDVNELFRQLSDQRNLVFLEFKIQQNSLLKITSSTFAKMFGKSIQNLLNLQILVLIIQPYNQIDQMGFQRIGDGLKSLNKLTSFAFQICQGGNPFNSESIKGICEGIGCVNKLTSLSLNIGSNNIQFEGAQAIGKCLRKLENLVNFSLQILEMNEINPGGACEIAQGLSCLCKLQSLQLCMNNNNIGQEGAQAFGRAFNQLKKLTNLVFKLQGLNYILNQGALAIGEGLISLQNLINLTFELGPENMLDTEGLLKLNLGFRSSKNLQSLSIIIDKNNYINSNGIEQIGFGLNFLIQLESLLIKIEGNLIVPEALEKLIEFKDLQKLKKLTLSFNDCQINEKGAQIIANRLMNLNKLNNLNICIDNDKILDEGMDAISESLNKIVNLKILTLKFNQSNNISINAKFWLIQQIKSLQFLQSLQIHIPGLEHNQQYIKLEKLLINKFSHLKRLIKYSFYF